jgi:hypothetical protein
MPPFVILEHDYPELHWDFMLENGENLRTWKLMQNPDNLLSQLTTETPLSIKAEESKPHRLLYLDYEGPISNGRGFVKRFDYGSFELIEQNESAIIVSLKGQSCTGLLKLAIDSM